MHEMNILICYMHESELRMQSYEAMNRSTWIWNFEDLEEKQPPDLGFTIHGTRTEVAALLAGEARRRRWPRWPDLEVAERGAGPGGDGGRGRGGRSRAERRGCRRC